MELEDHLKNDNDEEKIENTHICKCSDNCACQKGNVTNCCSSVKKIYK